MPPSPQRQRTPIHRIQRRIRYRGKRKSHEIHNQDRNRDPIDDIVAHFTEVEGGRFYYVAVDASEVAAVDAAGNADDVRDDKADIADSLDVEEGCVGSERDDSEAAADAEGEEDGVKGNVVVW